MPTIYIALGSNVGDRKDYLVRAVDAIMHSPGIQIVDLSRIIETEPVGMEPGQEPFLNAVMAAQTTLEPAELLTRLRAIEEALGRPRHHALNTARTIDLDVLFYDSLVLDTEGPPAVTIPHPRLQDRRFVLDPLLDVAPPGFVHPVLRKTLQQLRDELP